MSERPKFPQSKRPGMHYEPPSTVEQAAKLGFVPGVEVFERWTDDRRMAMTGSLSKRCTANADVR